jgi:hypothetical protein
MAHPPQKPRPWAGLNKSEWLQTGYRLARELQAELPDLQVLVRDAKDREVPVSEIPCNTASSRLGKAGSRPETTTGREGQRPKSARNGLGPAIGPPHRSLSRALFDREASLNGSVITRRHFL